MLDRGALRVAIPALIVSLFVSAANQRNDFHFYTKFFHLLLYFLAA